jgi:hypothetical protein
MKFSSILVLIAFSFFFTSCEEVVQVDLEKGAKKYVIDAFINDLSGTQKVRVIENSEFFLAEEPPAVTHANVVLKDLTSGIAYQFTNEGNGYYIYNVGVSDTMAKTDHQYELNVTIDGYLYKAISTKKRAAIVDTIAPELIPPGSGFGTPTTDSLWFCTLEAYDITGINTDYYWVKTFRNDSLLFGPGDISVCVDGTGGPVMLEGVQFTEFTAPATWLGFNLFPRGSTCKAEVHSISLDTYNFFNQANTQINNSGLFATTPENIKTNIITPSDAPIKATGWFNMASVASYSFKI